MQKSYDNLPYPDLSYFYTHPDHMAVLGRLMGIATPPVEQSRVLEIGCAGGGNLIPLAYGFPEGEFVGIDFSAQQIANGQAVVDGLGLKNITLQVMDIRDVPETLGQFDYIIAHGVYSWVSPEVQDKVMQLCKRHLAPNGIAYVSYNVYPGWSGLDVLRDAALYKIKDTDDMQERATRAWKLFDFLENTLPSNSPYGHFMRWNLSRMRAKSPDRGANAASYLLHGELEAENNPVYFHQFAAHAERHDLKYLTESKFRDVFPFDLSPEVLQSLDEKSHDIVEREQLVDFLRNKSFRRTLLCHADQSLAQGLSPEILQDFYVSSQAQFVEKKPDLRTAAVERFLSPDKLSIAIDHPVTKMALFSLSKAWPRAVAFKDLLTEARQRLGLSSAAADPEQLAQDAYILAGNLLQAFTYSQKLINLHLSSATVATRVAKLPVASPVARLQASRQEEVTNLWHRRIPLGSFERNLIMLLDGSVDRAAMVKAMVGYAEKTGFTLTQDDRPIDDWRELRKVLRASLDTYLQWLLESALLVG